MAKGRASLTLCALKANVANCYHSVHGSLSANCKALFLSACLCCHCSVDLCECRLWLDVLENSQGEEPFISRASVITQACSHRHNHLLEVLEIGSAKRLGLGACRLVQGNLCWCHSKKFPLSVLAQSLWVNVCPLMSTGQNT